MARLSVNVNKIALLRNARGQDTPNLMQCARDLVAAGAQGITVHPRPDQRHIQDADCAVLKELPCELNIEGYPDGRLMALVEQVRPAQCTLVPDSPDALTSDSGWDCIRHASMLVPLVSKLKRHNIRVSLFLNPDLAQVQPAYDTGADRIELFTGPYAHAFEKLAQQWEEKKTQRLDPVSHLAQEKQAQEKQAQKKDLDDIVQPYVACAQKARALGLEINAGHDLNLANLASFLKRVHGVAEVSIGHALVCTMLYDGMNSTISAYRRCIREAHLAL